ncbi:hypothetical protein IscW_ISCW004377 [Ixodes scapularis]|uniref:Secreted protein n=1 Tax=Ixodes scapularis TaxID=6945 RepID=B7PIS0_IXOSC|nr:hypothetical protein IscW_ISCW004377 [Ixodes scapularis]|eukprot:XP_002406098.1 hypothetical protein IscW_ISCW004377 [Ixodes scapularis]
MRLGGAPAKAWLVLAVLCAGTWADKAPKSRRPVLPASPSSVLAAEVEARIHQKRAAGSSKATGPAGEWWKVWWENYIPDVTDPTAVPHLTTPYPPVDYPR